jgi:hypothetical protein
MAEETIHVRSFRVVFDLERRIHRIDRFRVPLPYGLPLRSIGYAVVALVAILLASRLPVIGALLGLFPTPARLVLAPAAISYALTQLRLDGRSAHAAASAWLRYRLGPRRLVAFAGRPAQARVALSAVTFARPPETRPEACEGQSAQSGLQLRLDGVEQLELL